MTRLRLFIVDDEAPARARMKALLEDIAPECPHELVGEADSPSAAMAAIATLAPDVVLLDVQMPGMTGLELADHLAKNPTPPSVIFVTAFDEFALKAFEVRAVDYLLKPVRATRLADAIRRASDIRARAAPEARPASSNEKQLARARQNFSVLERGRVLLVPVHDVLYLRAELKYVTLHTRVQDYLIEESLTSIEDELSEVFVRVHRSTLVARHAIIGVEKGGTVEGDADADRAQDAWQVILRGVEERLPISRRQWSVIKSLVR